VVVAASTYNYNSMANNRHLFLINPWKNNPKFKRQRGRKAAEEENESQEQATAPLIAAFQKQRLRELSAALFQLQRARQREKEERFRVLGTIDLVRIHFYARFSDSLAAQFHARYGLSPVEYLHFNKTVLFEVIDQVRFRQFFEHISMIVQSPEGTTYTNQPYNLIALIYGFEFIGSRRRQLTGETSGLVLNLAASANREIFQRQLVALREFLVSNSEGVSYNEAVPDIIQVSAISRQGLSMIANNFDLVKAITSSRGIRIRPGTFGETTRDHGFTVTTSELLPIVGIIDTGISPNTPFQNSVLSQHYDQSGLGAFWDEAGHGTAVAGLVVLGEAYVQAEAEQYAAKARVMAIKALHDPNGAIDILRIVQDIRNAHITHGVRLFNMSLNIPGAKSYNSSYSTFAYELDKLAYRYDLLIFLSVGNIDSEHIESCRNADYHQEHDYPIFFYNPDNATSPIHRCFTTNICEPSESLNNLSIGALAGNFSTGIHAGLSPDGIYPAYYTRKFHIDYRQPVNTTTLGVNQRNKYLNKPDLVFEGGDLLEQNAGLQVLQAPTHQPAFFKMSCGTSFSTPLTASYAAELTALYPMLKMQSIKALLINVSSYFKRAALPEFNNSSDALLKSMVGFGRPKKAQLLATNDDSIVFVIEDKIKAGEILAMPIALPEYLLETNTKLKFEITLCYSFLPVKDNHLNYLPLHMSFNLISNCNAETLGEDQGRYGIKSSFSWSEDHYGIENRIFSNAQSYSYNLQSDDIKDHQDGVAIAVRCLIKKEVPESYSMNMNGVEHPFSLVIRVTELPTTKASGRLYKEMVAVNEVQNIADATGEQELEQEI